MLTNEGAVRKAADAMPLTKRSYPPRSFDDRSDNLSPLWR